MKELENGCKIEKNEEILLQTLAQFKKKQYFCTRKKDKPKHKIDKPQPQI